MRDTNDARDVREVILDMYRNLGNRAGFDKHLAPDLTVWESADPRMLRGIAQLDELRGPAIAPEERATPLPMVEPTQISVDAWSDAGVARYLLEVRDNATGDLLEEVRVTDVLRRQDDGVWQVIHHHAQDLAPQFSTRSAGEATNG